ncbi:MAG TPA: phosphoenolpyruvate--protein phosphotransferase [Verrucomicrobia bacterium]|nr:MAG: phosphoenolpyruvate--protein phosphotransferase [Lentisphaerae bacterium GWF2_57_35]HBA83738.1 phosphoenolpyruvate--protein phosphotransferase [Verrucomicrobiota bacterium]
MSEQLKEIELKGIGVSRGVAVGPVFLLTNEEDRLVEREIGEEDIPREIARFEEALISTRYQIHEIQQKVGEAIGQKSASIFDAHLLVVDDRAFVEEVIRGLSAQRKNVEAVLSSVANRYAKALEDLKDDYLRERAADIRDVTRRILRNLSGRSSQLLSQLEHPCVVIANDLAPSDTASLNRTKVIGFATDLGSPTSHTAIMARALEIPAVVGLHDVSVRVSPGDVVLIDGNKGLIIIHPTRERLERYGKIAEARQMIQSGLSALKNEQAVTRDGYNVLLSANIELPSDVEAVVGNGAYGVGLFRSEYLYLAQDGMPSEEEQFKAYDEVAQRLAPAPVIIRTLDLGGDKFLSHLKTPQELNPFMGWRAIRFCLAQPDIFKTQLRAILRASRHGNVKIMYPMISNVDEVLQANTFLEQAKHELRTKGISFNEDLEVGVMVEVPSAALTANLIAPHVNFFSLGTNDLVQYTLAVDRVNERIAYLYEPTHPAIMRLIKHTIDVGHEHDVWTGICGEMAGNPLMAPLLVGLGVDELSVSPTMVPLVKDAIRSIRYSQAEDLARAALASECAKDVLELCRKLTEEVAPEILELVE